ncbi:MAG TPA: GNAT family N-acetyltransferase, partial [Ilumatobacteraceae bacterium]|nr:GNAT family N-acetyltransferase [Ilumatobacteraceae bacterium]
MPDRIETERLVLRRWRVEDMPLLRAAITASIEHLRPWMPWVQHEPVSDADRVALIESWEQRWRDGIDFTMGVFLRDPDGVAPGAGGEISIGGSGLHRRGEPDSLEIGYWIHSDHIRHGYAREAAAAL